MKTKYEIRSRAKKLAVKYLKKYLSSKLDKLPENCKYNYTLNPAGTYYGSKMADLDITPRKHVSLLVIQPDNPIQICTKGTNTENMWNGDVICDSDAVSRRCKYFECKHEAKQVFEDFKSQLEDDEYTKLNYPDLAAFQWILSERFSFRIQFPFLWVKYFFVKVYLRLFKIKNTDSIELPKDIWS